MAPRAAAVSLLATALLPISEGQSFFSDTRCNEDNQTGCTERSPPRLEDNSNVVGFGIVTAIIILVVANLVICIARCLLSTSPSQTATGGRRASAHDLNIIRRTYSLKPVYVMNPGGSLRIGKQESKKAGAQRGGGHAGAGAAAEDLAERGMAQRPPEPSRAVGAVAAVGDAAEQV